MIGPKEGRAEIHLLVGFGTRGGERDDGFLEARELRGKQSEIFLVDLEVLLGVVLLDQAFPDEVNQGVLVLDRILGLWDHLPESLVQSPEHAPGVGSVLELAGVEFKGSRKRTLLLRGSMASNAEALVQFLSPLQGEVVEVRDFLGMIGLAQILNPGLLDLDLIGIGNLEGNCTACEPLARYSVDCFSGSHRIVARWELGCRQLARNDIGENQVGEGAGPVLEVADVSVLEGGGEVVRPFGDLKDMA